MKRIILGIETSCDETAAAVVAEDGTVLSDVVKSQVESFIPYGGVVPEIAARDHARHLPEVVREAVRVAGVKLQDVDAIAATNRPGLMGALLVGLMTAKGLAWSLNKPFIGVDHLVGHLLAVFLQRPGLSAERPSFPFAALLVSGGHTAIYRVDGPSLGAVRELGATRDDAAGEAFDKVAKLLGLGYPGGPVVDRLARLGDASRAGFTFQPALRGPNSYEMSFSGLKSAVARYVELNGCETEQARCDIAAAFQGHVVKILVEKTLSAASAEGLSTVVVGGGVAANSALAARFRERAKAFGVSVFIPPLASCTDNAAMIAYAGAVKFAAGDLDTLELAPNTRTSLLTVTRKGGGPRAPKPGQRKALSS